MSCLLEEIKLENFRGFQNYTLPLKQFSVLIGKNSSGKTSLLQAIQLVYDSIRLLFGGGEQANFANVNLRIDLTRPVSQLGHN